jgi:hypothetical protein
VGLDVCVCGPEARLVARPAASWCPGCQQLGKCWDLVVLSHYRDGLLVAELDPNLCRTGGGGGVWFGVQAARALG